MDDDGKPPKTAETAEAESRLCCWQAVTAIASVLSLALLVALIVCLATATDGFTSFELSMAPAATLASPAACPLDRTTLVADLDRLRARLLVEAARRPPVTWATYKAAPAQHAGRRVTLAQADFAHGTLRLRTSGVFTLAEDVVFSPNADADYRVNRTAQPGYAAVLAFRLGFFAALTVEAPNVMIDLGGHTLSQSVEHSVQQRAPFSLIELASQPFITGQGPTNFGQAVTSADGCVVENGRLGRSSHHAIHGNGGRNVLLRDLRARDYEVAAVALNGFKDVVIERVHAEGQSTAVPVMGTYSNARHLLPMAARALASPLISNQKKIELAARVAELEALMTHAFDDIVATGSISESSHPAAYALFANERGLIDGNCYSLILHPLGAAVNAFWSESPPASGSASATERIYVRDSSFAATHNHVIEVVALVSNETTAVRGPVGALLRLIDNEGRVRLFAEGDADGTYTGNALADTQVALMDAALDVTNATLRASLFGTLHGPLPVVRWARGELTLRQLVEDHGYRYWRNGDTMLHVNKGVTAVRVDGARDVCFDRVTVSDVCNTGRPGIVHRLPGEASDEAAAYVSAEDGGHPLQGRQYGYVVVVVVAAAAVADTHRYMGGDARGFSVAGSVGVHVRQLRVEGVHSYRGFARGIDVFNYATGVHVGPLCSVDNVTSQIVDSDDILTGNFATGPKVGAAIGVHCSGGSASSLYGARSIIVTNVRSGAFDQVRRQWRQWRQWRQRGCGGERYSHLLHFRHTSRASAPNRNWLTCKLCTRIRTNCKRGGHVDDDDDEFCRNGLFVEKSEILDGESVGQLDPPLPGGI